MVSANRLSAVPGIVLLSETGRVIFANDRAQDMLARGHPIANDLHGRLTCSANDGSHKQTQSLLSHLLMSFSQSFTMVSQPDEDGTVHHLRFAKLTPEAQIALPLDALLGFSKRCTLLLIAPQPSSNRALSQLKACYGLTDTELSLVDMLYDGLTNRQIAEQKARSILTINVHVKSILSKTECSTRTQFSRLVGELSS